MIKFRRKNKNTLIAAETLLLLINKDCVIFLEQYIALMLCEKNFFMKDKAKLRSW